jgi:hypothetical protein
MTFVPFKILGAKLLYSIRCMRKDSQTSLVNLMITERKLKSTIGMSVLVVDGSEVHVFEMMGVNH